jgi:hypothetical protein
MIILNNMRKAMSIQLWASQPRTQQYHPSKKPIFRSLPSQTPAFTKESYTPPNSTRLVAANTLSLKFTFLAGDELKNGSGLLCGE